MRGTRGNNGTNSIIKRETAVGRGSLQVDLLSSEKMGRKNYRKNKRNRA